MSFVTISQIQLRLKVFEELKQSLERRNGLLKRYETWQHDYYKFPYLIGSRSERVASRFRDVFINLSELDSTGKIGVYPKFEEDDSLSQKFTHLQQEWNVRGGVPSDVVADARKPVLKYFENGDPVATKLFSGFKPPSSPFLVKYSKREFLEPMLSNGTIRICPASYYSDHKHIDSIRDNETHRYFFIPTFQERLKGQTSIRFQGHDICFAEDDIEIPVVVPDYFMCSLCDHVYYRLTTDFEADAALIIKDPILFSQRVISAFLSMQTQWRPLVGNIIYYDPYRDYSKIWIPEMGKHFGYAYQREYRIAFKSNSHIKYGLEPLNIKIGSMVSFAELITLAS